MLAPQPQPVVGGGVKQIALVAFIAYAVWAEQANTEVPPETKPTYVIPGSGNR